MTSITIYLQENLSKITQLKHDTSAESEDINTSSIIEFGSSLFKKVKQAAGTTNQCQIHISPNIKPSILDTAIPNFSNYGEFSIEPKNVIGIVDTTILKNIQDGLLFTAKGIFYKKHFSNSVFIEFASINTVEVIGNEDEGQSIAIIFKDKSTMKLSMIANCNLRELYKIIETCSKNFEEYQEENVLVAMNDMDEHVKVAYASIIINMTFHNDNEVDEVELAEILCLMTRLEFRPESRLSVRKYFSSFDNLSTVESLIDLIREHSTPTAYKAIMVSLCKDLIFIRSSTRKDSLVTEEFAFFQEHKNLFGVSDDTIKLLRDAIELDKALLSEETTNEQIEAEMKKLAAKAAAVGTPIAAIYLSGSVIGLSAAGMTSGLATLGMGGVLGLSSMVTGIGVIILLGVGTYAGVKKFTGADEKGSQKRRELMLIAMEKQMQRTISELMEDINFISEKLNEAILGNQKSSAKLIELSNVLKKLAAAGKQLKTSASNSEKAKLKTHCPTFLDVDKLLGLTNSITGAKTREYVLKCYEKNEDGKLAIRSNLSVKELEVLSVAIEQIGYYNLSDVIVGAASQKASQAKDAVKGLFS